MHHLFWYVTGLNNFVQILGGRNIFWVVTSSASLIFQKIVVDILSAMKNLSCDIKKVL
jgi:hypothetical protein